MADSTPKKKKSLLGRILKWSGITLLLLIVTAIILPFLFKDKIIEMAKQEINNNVNATVTFGEFDLSLISSFPDFRFSIKDLKIVGKDKFDGDTLASIPSLKLDLDLMSVIKGDNYSINSIVMENPRIFAVVLPDGSASYDISKPSADTAAATPAAEATKFKMTLKHLEIDHAYIVYDDATIAVKTILDDFTHTLSGDFTQDLFDMETMTTIERFSCDYDGMTYLSKVKTSAKADLAMDMINWKFTFKDNEFTLNELGFGLDGFFAMPGDDYDMDLKFAAKQSEFKSFLSLIPGAYTTDFADVKSAGTLAFDGYAKGKYSESLKLSPGFGLNFQVKDGMFQYPSVPKAMSAINIDCKIDDASGVPDQTKIDLNTFHMDFGGGNPIDAALHVSTPVSDANLDGWVKGKVDLATMKDLMPLEKDDQLSGIVDADIKMKGRMSQIEQEKYDEFQCSGKLDVSNMLYKGAADTYETKISAMNMTFTPKAVELSKFDGMLGKNDVHANGHMDNVMSWLFKDSLLAGNFNFSSALMDLNEFASEEDAGAAPTAADSAPMTIIPVPANIDFVLNSTITKLIYDDITMDAVSGTATLRDSKVDLSNLKMNLMGGSMVVNGYYSTKNIMVPKVNFDMNISNFDVQQTFKTFNTLAAIAPMGQYTTGRFSTTMNYTSDLGADMMPIVETMNGGGTLSTQSVVVDGFPALKKLDEALKMNKFSKVTMQDIKMLSFKIENGNITTEPFDFSAGKATGKMGGSTKVDQTINYVMDVAIPRTEFGPANTALNGLVSGVQAKGIPFQLGDMVNVSALFTGTVTDPKVSVNLKEAGGSLVDNLTNTVVAVVDSVKDVAIDKGCDEAQRQLDAAKVTAANVKTGAYKLADDAKVKAYDQAAIIEKSYKSPLEKAAKKAAADAARKAADDANKKAKSDADATEKNSIAAAQAKKDATCK